MTYILNQPVIECHGGAQTSTRISAAMPGLVRTATGRWYDDYTGLSPDKSEPYRSIRDTVVRRSSRDDDALDVLPHDPLAGGTQSTKARPKRA